MQCSALIVFSAREYEELEVESEVAALAAVAAATLVKAVATTAWEKAKIGIGALWRRVHPERAATIQAELEETGSEVLQARQGGDEETEQGLVDEWTGRLRRLLTANPEVTAELRHLVENVLAPALAAAGAAGTSITMHAIAVDGGRVNQAGRDQHITEAPGP
jgi:hypothetical protein